MKSTNQLDSKTGCGEREESKWCSDTEPGFPSRHTYWKNPTGEKLWGAVTKFCFEHSFSKLWGRLGGGL